MSDDAIAAFRNAEHDLLEAHGVSAREHVFEARGTGTAVRYQEIGAGPPLLLVHGGGGAAAGFAPLLPHLEGHRLILPDRPGCGLSASVDYDGVDLRQHARTFIADVMDHAGVETCAAVGHSMGGLWSLWAAQQRPARIDRLVLIGAPALILETSAPFGMRLLGIRGVGNLMMAMEPPSERQVHTLWRRMGHDPDAVSPPVLTQMAVRAELLPQATRGWLSLLRRVFPGGRLARDLPGFDGTALAALEQPLLYVWGRRDPFADLDVARRAAELTAKGQLETIGEGHLPWLDEPEACGRAIRRFLGEQAGAQ